MKRLIEALDKYFVSVPNKFTDLAPWSGASWQQLLDSTMKSTVS